jgi:hypothetical protein
VLLFVLMTCGWLLAQKISGDISGDVTDSSGAVVPHAAVTAQNIGTNVTRAANTSDTGSFRINDLPIGTYRVSVTAGGFKTLERQVEVSAGGLTHADYVMQVGQLRRLSMLRVLLR